MYIFINLAEFMSIRTLPFPDYDVILRKMLILSMFHFLQYIQETVIKIGEVELLSLNPLSSMSDTCSGYNLDVRCES